MKINLLSENLKKTFGCKVYKLSLDGGMTCPNRDGTVGKNGCIFCSAKGSGDFAEQPCASIAMQLQNAKARVSDKIKSGKYIAYFQSFSNTYAPVPYLKKIFTEAIHQHDIVALSIATRPDCLNNDVLSLLEELNTVKPVWVELGLQTVHAVTAEYIRRGYPLEVFDLAVKELKKRGITVIAHMIIGLPGETNDMIYKTAEYIGKSGAEGIKFHLLHVLKGTDLEKDYLSGRFALPDLISYTDILAECIRRIPPETVIHRLTGDGSKAELIAPLWSADKKHVLNYINSRFCEINLIQGEHFY